jgi:hypothetical protein
VVQNYVYYGHDGFINLKMGSARASSLKIYRLKQK